jgi:hypothetical protein
MPWLGIYENPIVLRRLTRRGKHSGWELTVEHQQSMISVISRGGDQSLTVAAKIPLRSENMRRPRIFWISSFKYLLDAV